MYILDSRFEYTNKEIGNLIQITEKKVIYKT